MTCALVPILAFCSLNPSLAIDEESPLEQSGAVYCDDRVASGLMPSFKRQTRFWVQTGAVKRNCPKVKE